jgi:hypothetical protein
VKHPAPSALRLVPALVDGAPHPPLGLQWFDPDAPSIAILLLGSAAELRDPAAIARQLPDPATLPPLSLVFVLGTSAKRHGLLGRWFGVGATLVPTAVRCTALLARGYFRIGAFVDGFSRGSLVYATSSEPNEPQ